MSIVDVIREVFGRTKTAKVRRGHFVQGRTFCLFSLDAASNELLSPRYNRSEVFFDNDGSGCGGGQCFGPLVAAKACSPLVDGQIVHSSLIHICSTHYCYKQYLPSKIVK